MTVEMQFVHDEKEKFNYASFRKNGELVCADVWLDMINTRVELKTWLAHLSENSWFDESMRNRFTDRIEQQLNNY